MLQIQCPMLYGSNNLFPRTPLIWSQYSGGGIPCPKIVLFRQAFWRTYYKLFHNLALCKARQDDQTIWIFLRYREFLSQRIIVALFIHLLKYHHFASLKVLGLESTSSTQQEWARLVKRWRFMDFWICNGFWKELLNKQARIQFRSKEEEKMGRIKRTKT